MQEPGSATPKKPRLNKPLWYFVCIPLIVWAVCSIGPLGLPGALGAGLLIATSLKVRKKFD